MIDLSEVLTFSEAAEKWGFSDGNTIRKAVERNKFNPDEIRKSGNVWLTTYPAMVRVFGIPKEVHHVISYHHISELVSKSLFDHKDMDDEIQKILDDISEMIDKGGNVHIIESESKPDNIIMILRRKEDLKTFAIMVKRYMALMKY